MKKKIAIAVMYTLLTIGFLSAANQRAAAQVSVSFQVFYDNLSPYGSWINYPEYGYVWIPTQVPQGFRPYSTGGHWVYTDSGWAWVSDYDWGWAPFHYGNWFYDQYYGWMWLPDYDWAPAWVTWGDYGDNYCWAPIGPRVSFGISYRPPIYCWTFLPHARIGSANMSNYYVSHVNNTTIINNITVINNVNTAGGRGYVRGPQPQSVERFTHAPVRPVVIQTSARPGRATVQNGQVAIYRPTINRGAGATPAPAHVQDFHALQQHALPARSTSIQQQTFAAAHVNSPLRPANNTPANRVNTSPSNNAPADRPVSTPTHRTNNPATNTPTNNPRTSNPRTNPTRNHPVNPGNNHPATQPAPHQQPVPHNNNPTHTVPNRQPAQSQPAQRQPAQRQPVQRQPAQRQPVQRAAPAPHPANPQDHH